MRKIVITYFTATGVTSKVAETLAVAVNADLHEIIPVIPYTADDLNWTNKNSRSSIEMSDLSSRPEIANKVKNMDDYDVIFLGFPIWWYVAPTIINTFLESYNLSGKTIILFATSGGSGFGRTLEKLEDSCNGAILKEGKMFNGPVDKAELAKWAESMMK